MSTGSSYPQTILSATPLLKQYATTAHSIGLQILHSLFTQLGVPNSRDELGSRHAFDRAARDDIRMIRGPPRSSPDAGQPEIATPAHSDRGSVTVLMNWLGGLQVWSEPSKPNGEISAADGAGEWLWVRPQPNCAIINLGGTAEKFSNGALRAALHRVVPAPGEQGSWPRYSVVYFIRPNDDCVLKRLEGSGIPNQPDDDEEEAVTATEWIAAQAQKLRIGDK
jgi:isopenicillin N synthase-like dioxygenase